MNRKHILICVLIFIINAKNSLSDSLFETIIWKLELNKEAKNHLEKNFDIDTLQLVSPFTEFDLNINSPCVFSIKRKGINNDPYVIVKIIGQDQINTWYNQKNDTSQCKKNYNSIPMEYYVAKEMSKKSRFVEFFPNLYYQDKKENSFYIFVYHHFKNSLNLREWFEEQVNSQIDNTIIENRLKIIFLQMYEALLSLYNKNLVYIDFKPENVLINKNNKKGSSFLLNLEPVVKLYNGKINEICKASPQYFPPSEGRSLNEFAVNFLKINNNNNIKANHILTWQYCLSIYSLVCDKAFKNEEGFNSRTIFSKWRNNNAPLNRYVKCSSDKFKMTKSLEDLLSSCLLKKIEDSKFQKFEDLKNSEWLKEMTQIDF